MLCEEMPPKNNNEAITFRSIKREESEEIERQTKEFLSNEGKIEEVPINYASQKLQSEKNAAQPKSLRLSVAVGSKIGGQTRKEKSTYAATGTTNFGDGGNRSKIKGKSGHQNIKLNQTCVTFVLRSNVIKSVSIIDGNIEKALSEIVILRDKYREQNNMKPADY